MKTVKIKIICKATLFLVVFWLSCVNLISAQVVPGISPALTTGNIEQAEVSPIEMLTQEHGIVSRLLLIYEELGRRLDRDQSFPPSSLINSTEIIRNFIQGFHEKLEEKYIFQRFREAGTQTYLVNTLQEQHAAGRKIIEDILFLEKSNDHADKIKLAESIYAFIHLYQPHKAWEDTVLYPTFHNVVSVQVYRELGETFQREERQYFGKSGLENIVGQVSAIEKELGLSDLADFTPYQLSYVLPND